MGMGATVLDGAKVQRGAIVAAGALVTPGTIVPSGESLLLRAQASLRVGKQVWRSFATSEPFSWLCPRTPHASCIAQRLPKTP